MILICSRVDTVVSTKSDQPFAEKEGKLAVLVHVWTRPISCQPPLWLQQHPIPRMTLADKDWDYQLVLLVLSVFFHRSQRFFLLLFQLSFFGGGPCFLKRRKH